MDTEPDQLLCMPQRRLGEDLWHQAESLSRERLLRLVERHSLSDRHYSVNVLVRHCTERSPLAALVEAASRFGTIEVLPAMAAVSGVMEMRHSGLDTTYLAVVQGHLPDVWLLVTDTSRSSDEYDKMIAPALRVCAPRLPHAWLSTRQFKNTVMGMAQSANLDLVPTRVSSVQRDGSVIRFPRRTTGAELFRRLERDEAVLRGLDFRLGSAERPALTASLARECRIRYRNGSLHALEQLLLAPLEVHTQRHFRSLRPPVDTEAAGRGVCFKFRRNVMADTSANKRLVDALGRLRRASVNAYHSNPYLHVGIVDLWDGSTMDLFAHVADELEVIPGPYCSDQAVSRVFDHVYDSFAPGEIADVCEIVPEPNQG